jgi:hypothetical protein
MSRAELVVTGKEEVIAGLEAMARAAGDLTVPHRAILAKLVPEVASRTPRRTGALAVSWGSTAGPSEASIESPLRYAAAVEAGTIHMAGAHMVGDTLASSSDEIVAGYEDALAAAGSRAGFGVSR